MFFRSVCYCKLPFLPTYAAILMLVNLVTFTASNIHLPVIPEH